MGGPMRWLFAAAVASAARDDECLLLRLPGPRPSRPVAAGALGEMAALRPRALESSNAREDSVARGTARRSGSCPSFADSRVTFGKIIHASHQRAASQASVNNASAFSRPTDAAGEIVGRLTG